ncbi:MAG: SH3 domain-containing protein [Chloroflexota bacterium]
MKDILNLRVVVGAAIIGLVLTCASLVYIILAYPLMNARTPTLAAAVTVILGPTSTPRSVPPTQTMLPPTPTPSPTPLPGTIHVGSFVQVTGTEGEGLRIRSAPSLNATPLFIGFDNEIFRVTAGPRDADGYHWWYLTAPYDESRSGWAAADYLTFIETP